VSAINRGEGRVLQSVVIDLDGDEAETFASYNPSQLSGLSYEDVRDNLNNAGLWAALRTRPFSKSPALDSRPNSIFITAMDTNPLAANPELIIREHADDFANGVTVLSRLTEGTTYVCKAVGADIPVP